MIRLRFVPRVDKQKGWLTLGIEDTAFGNSAFRKDQTMSDQHCPECVHEYQEKPKELTEGEKIVEDIFSRPSSAYPDKLCCIVPMPMSQGTCKDWLKESVMSPEKCTDCKVIGARYLDLYLASTRPAEAEESLPQPPHL